MRGEWLALFGGFTPLAVASLIAVTHNNLAPGLYLMIAAVVSLFHNGATVFNALSHNQTALRSLITTGETVFATTAANNRALAATFHVFPTFLFETKLTMRRLQSFALNTDPLIRALEPWHASWPQPRWKIGCTRHL